MFKPSPILNAYMELLKAVPNPAATAAAEQLESSVKNELLQAWLNLQIVPAQTLPTMTKSVTVSNGVVTVSNEIQEASQEPASLGKLPRAYNANPRLINAQVVRKLWKKKSESLGITQTQLAKAVGLSSYGAINALRSTSRIINSSHADFMVELLGREVLA